MKKIAIFIAILSILSSFHLGVSADAVTKDIPIVLSDAAAIVNVGETIDLTATTEKHGSAYTDEWENAIKNSTELNSNTGSYVSKATFIAEKPGIYTVTYEIKMTSGSGNTVFSQKVAHTIEVIDPVTLVGAAIRDLSITPIYKADGSISAYSAFGTTHALWSNNTSTPKGSIYFFFGPNEISKVISVTININCQPYTYMVTVDRQVQ